MKKSTASKAAAALGSIKTAKKAAAVRENGKLGGRPATRTTYCTYHELTGRIGSKHLSAKAAVAARQKLRKLGGDLAWGVEIFQGETPVQPETRDEIVRQAEHDLGLC